MSFYGKHLPWLKQESVFLREEILGFLDIQKFSKFRYAGDYFFFHSFIANGIPLKSLVDVIASFSRYEDYISENQVSCWNEAESFAGPYVINIITQSFNFAVVKAAL